MTNSELLKVIAALVEQLEMAHAEAFNGCDGTCSYHEALNMGRRAMEDLS